MNYQSYVLHEYPEFRKHCSDVLNEEWPRSETARLHMLEKSCEKLPYSIVLVDKSSNENEVIGHSRLCKVHGHTNACFVESVVIKKKRRGQGLGRELMKHTEEHARRLGIVTVYLTTHDKQFFYQHVGYEFCKPIVTLGSGASLMSEAMFERLFGHFEVCNDSKSKAKDLLGTESTDSCNREVTKQNSKTSATSTKSSQESQNVPQQNIPLPPPPPPPPCSESNPNEKQASAQIYWMKKEL